MIITISKKSLINLIFLVIIVPMFAFGLSSSDAASVFFAERERNLPIYCVENNNNVVALTFDAAWGADKTEKIMDILESYEVPATFFLVGFWVDKYPEMVAQIDSRGYEIGSHSNSHLDMTKLSREDIIRDLSITNDKLKAITNKDVTVFRSPFGAYNNTLINTVRELNMEPIQWSVDSLDWKGLNANEITGRIVSRVHAGAIVLCHNNSDHITDALPNTIELLKARGYIFTTVGELIYRENYFIDNNGMQHTKNA